MGYWMNHPDLWPVDPDSCLAMTCGLAWIDILHTPADPGNAWKILAGHWITAVLNSLAGADVSELQDAMDAAEALLAGCEIDDDDRDLALDLATELDGTTCEL